MGLLSKLSNRERIIISFLVVLVLLNILTLITSRNLADFSQDFKSMLEDRLIPSSDLAKIQELMYQNRLKLEEMVYLHENQNTQKLVREVKNNNEQIDRIKAKYAKTHLTADEAVNLDEFNRLMKNYRQIEDKVFQQMLQDNFSQASDIYLRESMPAFESLLTTTHTLKNIQVTVGEKLYRHAEKKVNSIQIFAYLSLGISLMITLNMLKVLRYKVK